MIRALRARTDRAKLVISAEPRNPLRKLEGWDVDLDTGEGFSVLVGYEPVSLPSQVPDYRWHISIGGPERVPAWNEFVAIAHRLRPGVMFCLPLPPRSFWLNENEYVLHAWEIRDDNLTASWRSNPSVKAPT